MHASTSHITDSIALPVQGNGCLIETPFFDRVIFKQRVLVVDITRFSSGLHSQLSPRFSAIPADILVEFSTSNKVMVLSQRRV